MECEYCGTPEIFEMDIHVREHDDHGVCCSVCIPPSTHGWD